MNQASLANRGVEGAAHEAQDWILDAYCSEQLGKELKRLVGYGPYFSTLSQIVFCHSLRVSWQMITLLFPPV